MNTMIYDMILDTTKVDLPMITEILSYIPVENVDKDIIASNIFYILNQEEEKVVKEYVFTRRHDIIEQIKKIDYDSFKEILIKIINLLPFRDFNGYDWKTIFSEDVVINFCYEFIHNDFKCSPEMCINMVTSMMNQSKLHT